MSFTVTINYGSGDVSLTNYSGVNLVYAGSLKKTSELYSKDFKPVTNQAWFSIKPQPSLMSALFGLDRDQEISVVIQEDGSDWFTGYVRPITKFEDKVSGRDEVSFECVDEGWKLHAKPSTYISRDADDNMTVCDTTTTSQSMIHWLLNQAWGGTFPNSVTAFDVAEDIEHFLINNKTYFEILRELCFSHHLTFYFDESGDFVLYDWGATSVSSLATLDEDDMVGKLSISRSDESVDVPEVEYYSLDLSKGLSLSEVSTGAVIAPTAVVTDTGGSTTWTDVAGMTKGTVTVDETWSLDVGLTISEDCQGVEGVASTIKTDMVAYSIVSHVWIPSVLGSSDLGYPSNMKVATPGSAYYRPGWADNNIISLSATLSGGFVASLSAEHVYPGTMYSGYFIYGVSVTGNCWMRQYAGSALGAATTGATKEYKALYCYNSAAAAELATALYKNLENGEYVYKWDSEDSLTDGGYYTVNNSTANKSAIVRITKKTENVRKNGSKLYSYEAKQFEGLGSVYTSVTEYTAPIVETGTPSDGVDVIVGETLGAAGATVLPETGLYLFSDKFGYYDATAEEWKSYIASDGKFKFSGTGSNVIEFDGTDLTINADVALNGTVETGDAIQSSDYNAGVAGWQIDGDGDAEFNSITIRDEVMEAVMTSYTSGLTIGFDGTGTTTSPDEGDRRVLVDNDEISFQEYTDGAWSSYNQVSLCGADSNGNFYPFLSCRGVVNPLAGEESTEYLPSSTFRLFNCENNLQDQYGDDPWSSSNTGFSGSAKFGDYSLSSTGGVNGQGFIYKSLSWNGSDPFTHGCWVLISETGWSNGGTATVLQMYNGAGGNLSIGYNNSSNVVVTCTLTSSTISKTVTDFTLSIGWHYFAVTADPLTGYLRWVVDGNTEDIDVGTTWYTPSSPTIYFRVWQGTTNNPEHYIDEIVTAVGEYLDSDAIIQHYNHEENWSSRATAKDIVIKPADGGRVVSDYPAGYIYGLETESATDTDHDITINPGKCRSYSDLYNLDLNASITKQIDATWSAGTDAGGLFSGTVAASTTYHLFLIRKDSDGSIDAGFDTDIDCSNIPSGYTAYRRIASFLTDSSANIRGFFQKGDRFYYTTVPSTTFSTISTSRQFQSVPIPVAPIIGIFALQLSGVTSGTTNINFTSPHEESSSVGSLLSASSGYFQRIELEIYTDDATVGYKASQVNGVVASRNRGYIDARGQYGGK